MQKQGNDSKSYRILMIGAHPDDCEIKAGATAFALSQHGHVVKFISLTNGEAGHQTNYGPELVKRRILEASLSARILGAESEVLDNRDGQLEPSLSLRIQVVKKIREFNADIVITHRSNDYHPDHRYTGIVVQDALYMVCVPAVASEVEPLIKNPVVMYFEDKFSKPNEFSCDIVVNINNYLEVKFDALCEHRSQFFEWLPWIERITPPTNKEELKEWLLNSWFTKMTTDLKSKLKKTFDDDFVDSLQHIEAFEIGEYGSQIDRSEIERLFVHTKYK
jgi:LmbE family N-acetylglucosaminyl deacetylase